MSYIPGKVSVLIASRNECYLQCTVDDIFAKAEGDVEVIVVLDGYWPAPPLHDHKNLVIIHKPVSVGLRPAINAAAAVATGEFVMKTDAHCMFGQGFDTILKADCEADWLVVPRRVSLDPEKWCVAETGRSPVDYEYISYPYKDFVAGTRMPSVRVGNVWNDRARERLHISIDDDMSFQGSCWFMHRDYFREKIGPLQSEGWGTFVLEPEELGNKVWLSGGRVIINKKTQYAHWHKGKNGRGYFIDRRGLLHGREFNIDYWMNNRWLKAIHPFSWLIDKFWPVPTWPTDWKEIGDPRLHKTEVPIS
jgi:glycosyltransferase involved in cell wall biosynthesis